MYARVYVRVYVCVYVRTECSRILSSSQAVNQAAGRVIRHKADHGAVLFLDARYAGYERLREMSKWVEKNLRLKQMIQNTPWSCVHKALVDFFHPRACQSPTMTKSILSPPTSQSQTPPITTPSSITSTQLLQQSKLRSITHIKGKKTVPISILSMLKDKGCLRQKSVQQEDDIDHTPPPVVREISAITTLSIPQTKNGKERFRLEGLHNVADQDEN